MKKMNKNHVMNFEIIFKYIFFDFHNIKFINQIGSVCDDLKRRKKFVFNQSKNLLEGSIVYIQEKTVMIG